MSYTILTHKDVLTKKPHTCIFCLRKFNKGIGMTYQSGIYDGDFYSNYTCETCDKIIDMDTESDCEEGYPRGYVNEMLDVKQSPEELLQQLREKEEKQICLNLEKIKKKLSKNEYK